jgi:multidrug efflux pump subunit AcrB
MAEVRRIASETLPQGYGFEWSGASLQEIRAGNQAPYVIAFGLLVVFLVLAAQYESWSLPIAVILAVPLGAFGAILAVFLRGGMSQDIYFQIGLLTLVGLAAKNAILIVEFGSALRKLGMPLVQATIEAARLRLRPILMTSFAFILGVLPLAISTGAGAAGRRSIGTGVMGGMISATLLAVIFIPVFFLVVQGGVEWIQSKLGRQPVGAAPLSASDGEALALMEALSGGQQKGTDHGGTASTWDSSSRDNQKDKDENDPGADTQPLIPKDR